MAKVSKQDIVDYLKSIIANEIKESVDQISEHTSFHEFGLDSINSIYLLDQVQLEYDLTLTPLYFWDYPNIASFANQLFKEINS